MLWNNLFTRLLLDLPQEVEKPSVETDEQEEHLRAMFIREQVDGPSEPTEYYRSSPYWPERLSTITDREFPAFM